LEKDKLNLVLFQKIESRMGKFHAVFGILKLSFWLGSYIATSNNMNN
jgi:hypothetical protein